MTAVDGNFGVQAMAIALADSTMFLESGSLIANNLPVAPLPSDRLKQGRRGAGASTHSPEPEPVRAILCSGHSTVSIAGATVANNGIGASTGHLPFLSISAKCATELGPGASVWAQFESVWPSLYVGEGVVDIFWTIPGHLVNTGPPSRVLLSSVEAEVVAFSDDSVTVIVGPAPKYAAGGGMM